MSDPKFKVGDVLKVVRYHEGRSGSVPRGNFIVKKIDVYDDHIDESVYFPDDNKQGAFEDQLEYEKITWREKLCNNTK